MPENRKVIIYGMGSFAQLVKLYLNREPSLEVVAYVADQDFLADTREFDDLPLVAFEQLDSLFPAANYSMLVVAGYSSMRRRQVMFEKAQNKGYSFINYISESAIVDETVAIGSNNVILEATIIEPNAVIGSNNILWSGVTISHNAQIENHCFLASRSLVGGYSRVSDGCFLGFNSVCVQEVHLGRESLIGANSLVLQNTLPFSRNYGSPAVQVGNHETKGIRIK